MKAYFGMSKPPVKIGKIAIGDGSITSEQVFEFVPSVSFSSCDIFTQAQRFLQIKVIETFPQLINYDTEVYKYFKEQ